MFDPDDKELLQVIKSNLETTGTKFGEYYGGTIIHSSGPKPMEFFTQLNEGNFTIDILKVPDRFITKTVDMKKLTIYLTKRTKDD